MSSIENDSHAERHAENAFSAVIQLKLFRDTGADSERFVSQTELELAPKLGADNVVVLAERFPYYASVEVNDLHWLRAHFTGSTCNRVVAAVRKILAQEFGRKRVTRAGYQFLIPHRNADNLIAALLRVQFYTNQILLPEYNFQGERMEQNGVSITWGVGRDATQAAQDCIRKQKTRLPGSSLSRDP